jgi:hypothetical protein
MRRGRRPLTSPDNHHAAGRNHLLSLSCVSTRLALRLCRFAANELQGRRRCSKTKLCCRSRSLGSSRLGARLPNGYVRRAFSLPLTLFRFPFTVPLFISGSCRGGTPRARSRRFVRSRANLPFLSIDLVLAVRSLGSCECPRFFSLGGLFFFANLL